MEQKNIIDVVLDFVRSTKGTHIFGNEDEGFHGIYVPKDKFPGMPTKGAQLRLRLDIVGKE